MKLFLGVNCHVKYEMGNTTNLELPMSAAKEPVKRLRFIHGDGMRPGAETLPEPIMILLRTRQKEVVDIDAEQKLFLWEPEAAGVTFYLQTTSLYNRFG